MPYDAPGKRINDLVWDGGANGTTPLHTNRFVFIDNKVVLATKTTQIDRFVRPDSAAAIEIQPGEKFVGFHGGVHELELTEALGLTNLQRGDKLWLDTGGDGTTILITPGGGTGGAPANEKQSVKVQGSAGNFKLKWVAPDGTEGETGNIKFNATAAEVQAALEATAAINAGDVVVTGGPGNEAGSTPYVVEFKGRYADTDVALITATDTLTGGEEKVTVTATQAGAPSGDVVVPLGVIDSIDATRTPHVARVDTDAWHAFITS